ncbi:YopX family protein [Bacillus atrophaeus]|uniref:YopX family protein n=1 Tax=Bacillus atrophaeus TaxID=1452 RepID=UPI00228059A0|nr:YopX family protein [Bacillus atrophaeus]MCY8513782.1 YopX family protein [Bacillus atrophaeus]MCY8993414.1 YopX family protein [Bacillus atrophaeus]
MNNIKIRYAFRHKETGNIELKTYSISQLEERPPRKLSPVFCEEFGYELISRDLWTCLKDSNGENIYGRDFIKITYDTAFSKEPFYVGMVKYLENEDYPAFDLRPPIDLDMNALSWLKSESDPSVKKYEVIGNIHQNPELLGGVAN